MLRSVNVLELEGRLAVGICGRLLADVGADVVRVAFSEGSIQQSGDDPGFADFLNGGKDLVEIPPGTSDVLAGLVGRADVILAPDHAAALSLRAICHGGRPTPVIVIVSDYGLDGLESTEFVVQAESGVMALHDTGDGPPVWSNVDLGEVVAGIYAAVGAVTALMARCAGAESIDVDVSVLEALANVMPAPALSQQIEGHLPYTYPFRMVPGVVETADGWVCIVAINDVQWAALRTIITDDRLDDARFASLDGRLRHAALIRPIVAEFVRLKTTATMVDLGSTRRVPVSPVVAPENSATLAPYAERDAFVLNPKSGVAQPGRMHREVDAPAKGPTPPRDVSAADVLRRWSEAPRSGNGQFGTDPNLPLLGIRVLDLTHFVAGPCASAYLAYLGADVIHVESPMRPDYLRMSGVDMSRERWWERNSQWHTWNRGKRAITVDFTEASGRAVLERLARQSDVVVENFSPRVLDDRRLGHEGLRALKPELIVVRMPAFGLGGSWRDRPGMAFDVDAMSGLAYATGNSDQEPLLSSNILDPASGMLAAYVTMSALWRRAETGEGASIELPLASVGTLIMSRRSTGANRQTRRVGNESAHNWPQGVYRSSDGVWLALSIATDAQWATFRRSFQGFEILDDDRLASADGRRVHIAEVHSVISGVFSGLRSDGVVLRLREHGVPIAVVSSGTDILEHEAVLRRDRVFSPDDDHPVVGRLRHLGFPMRMSYQPAASLVRPAPIFGQDNEEVLRMLGYTEADIRELEAGNVIAAKPSGVG